MIGIIDYGMGNLRSVENALKHLGYDSMISSKKEELDTCDKLILPGVGAFGDCMQNIHSYGLYDYIKNTKKPLLGICLGMQMLFEESEEKGNHTGFGFIQGKVILIDDPNVVIPEIGWNLLEFNQQHPLKDELSDKPFVYYVHSFYATDIEDNALVAYSMYGNTKVTGIVMKDNIMGCQFHPEKSGEDGLKILKYFVEDFV